jgi:flagellar hook assembly protein FlgD
VGGGTYYDMATVKYFSPVGVQENKIVTTERLLLEVYPNPTRVISTISYSLSHAGRVSLSVYDVSGRLVRTLIDQHQEPDVYSFIWDSKDNAERRIAPGIYFCILRTDNGHTSKKLVTIE